MNISQETQLGRELRRMVSDQPFQPDIEAIGQRARKRHRRGIAVRAAVSAGAAVVVAGGVFTAVNGTGGTATGPTASPAPASKSGIPGVQANSRLMSLAAFIRSGGVSQPGDASLVVTSQDIGGKQFAAEYFVYADKGPIYSAGSASGLPEAVASGRSIADGTDARELAAARYAATGDLASARVKMVNITGSALGLGLSPAARQKVWAQDAAARAKIYKEKGVTPPADSGPPTGKVLEERAGNNIWTGVLDALASGGGNPEVRAGALRLLATVPEITVTKSMTNGEATLTLAAGPALFGGGHRETLIVDARTGSPLRLVSGGGGAPAATQTYKVSRVTLAGVEKGKF